jgi:hypothetical protein
MRTSGIAEQAESSDRIPGTGSSQYWPHLSSNDPRSCARLSAAAGTACNGDKAAKAALRFNEAS